MQKSVRFGGADNCVRCHIHLPICQFSWCCI